MSVPHIRLSARPPLGTLLLALLFFDCGSSDRVPTPVAPSVAPPPLSPAAPAPSAPLPLELSCQAEPRVGAVPLSVSFRSFPSGGTGTYDFTWAFGDGAISHQRHPAHVYARPGVFSASVTVTSGDQVRGCERSITASGETGNPAPPGPPAPPLPDVLITITGINGGMSFSPNPASARVGQKVIWRNADALPHTATANGGAFDTGIVTAGASSAPVAMGAAGTFPYHCSVHPSMVGTLTVTP
jgi:hypothetical protein